MLPGIRTTGQQPPHSPAALWFQSPFASVIRRSGPGPLLPGGRWPLPLGEYLRAPGAPGKVLPRFGVAPRVGVQDSHASVWPLEWSVTHERGIL